MEIKHYLLATGVSIIAYLAPEVLVSAFKVNVPFMFNLLAGIAGACIALYFVL